MTGALPPPPLQTPLQTPQQTPPQAEPPTLSPARPRRALVWLKRDLRVADHAPLQRARGFERAIAFYAIEPAWLASPEFDPQHLAYTLASLAELRARGLPLLVLRGAMPALLERLHAAWPFDELLSHEETGPGWTYQRDRAVAAWCRGQGVAWQECAQTGVVRRLKSRLGWAGRWQARMDAPQEQSDHAQGRISLGGPGENAPSALHEALAKPLPTLADLLGPGVACRPLPPAGEATAQAVLHDFLHHRGRDYRRALSSPLSAEAGCSRLSAHLAFGTISLRQVNQATEARIAALRSELLAPLDADGLDPQQRAAFAHALRGFAGRLRWHCHFMQKLEDEPAIEFTPFAKSAIGLRDESLREDGLHAPGTPEATRLAAWCAGQTGFPMVDACMRSLVATGWLNFRMRAMLVSFAAYQLWLHWRAPGLHLARQFLDFEAGIHWSQMQMQSGTTAINTLRMYSPVKQAQDQDPEGRFIRHWLPELAGVPLAHLAAPWTMSPTQQQAVGCVLGRDYPAPIVDPQRALAEAKDKLYAWRARAEVQAEADAIQQRHGSRRSGLPNSLGKPRRSAGSRTRSAPDAALQHDLFDT